MTVLKFSGKETKISIPCVEKLSLKKLNSHNISYFLRIYKVLQELY